MDMPEGWKRVLKEYECLKSYHETRQSDMPFVLDLLREMAEALEDACKRMPLRAYNLYTEKPPEPYLAEKVLKKFKEWK